MGFIKDVWELLGPHKHGWMPWEILKVGKKNIVKEKCVCGESRYLKDRYHHLDGSLVEGYSLKEIEKYDTKFKR